VRDFDQLFADLNRMMEIAGNDRLRPRECGTYCSISLTKGRPDAHLVQNVPHSDVGGGTSKRPSSSHGNGRPTRSGCTASIRLRETRDVGRWHEP